MRAAITWRGPSDGVLECVYEGDFVFFERFLLGFYSGFDASSLAFADGKRNFADGFVHSGMMRTICSHIFVLLNVG